MPYYHSALVCHCDNQSSGVVLEGFAEMTTVKSSVYQALVTKRFKGYSRQPNAPLPILALHLVDEINRRFLESNWGEAELVRTFARDAPHLPSYPS